MSGLLIYHAVPLPVFSLTDFSMTQEVDATKWQQLSVSMAGPIWPKITDFASLLRCLVGLSQSKEKMLNFWRQIHK